MSRTRRQGFRSLSFSEIQTALTCQAQWDFSYGGHLAGSVLKPRHLAPQLSGGRAWGAALQAFHSGDGSHYARLAAHGALLDSARDSLWEQAGKGVWVDLAAQVEQERELQAILDHYLQTAKPLKGIIGMIEREFNVALPSRSGGRSNLYRLQGFLDGEDGAGRWLVEYKLRFGGGLTPPDVLQNSRQVLWYAWSRMQEERGWKPLGVIVDERLAEAPKPPNVNKNGKPSHDKNQKTTPEWYVAVCEELGDEPKDHVIEYLRRRQWQQRVEVMFRPDEFEQAERELVSAAKLIRQLDSGELYPIRNAQSRMCRGCKFREICPSPRDTLFVESQFVRRPPKRDRGRDEQLELVA